MDGPATLILHFMPMKMKENSYAMLNKYTKTNALSFFLSLCVGIVSRLVYSRLKYMYWDESNLLACCVFSNSIIVLMFGLCFPVELLLILAVHGRICLCVCARISSISKRAFKC